MKKTILISAAIFAYCVLQTANCFPQGTSINSTGAKADSSAMLDVESSTQGLLIPRMSEAQKNAIPRPAPALLIYQTDGTQPGYYFNAGDKTTKNWMYVGGDDLGNHTAKDSLNMSMNKIVNLSTCTYNYDAANKLYVDNSVAAGGGGGGGISINEITPLINGGANMTLQICIDSCYSSVRNGKTDWRTPTFEEYTFARSALTPPTSWASTYCWTISRFEGSAGNWLIFYESASDWSYNGAYNSRGCRCVR